MADRAPNRARLSPETRKAALLRVGREVFAEVGHDDFLPSAVAERAGVSEATIYRYYPTKRELLVSVAEDWLDEILTEEPEFSGELPSRLRQAVRYALWVVKRQPVLTRFIITVLRSDPSYRSMEIYQLNRRFTASIVKVVDDGVEAGLLRADLPRRLVRDMIFGAVELQTWAHLRGGSEFSVDEAADTIAGIIYRGMLAPPPDAESQRAAIEDMKKQIAVLERALLGPT